MEAVHLAKEMQAEYWSVSAKTGEWARAFHHSGLGASCGGLTHFLPRAC